MKIKFSGGALAALLAVSAAAYEPVDCVADCEGHHAGYEWAADQGLSEAADYEGNSESFIAGCLDYVAQQGDADWLGEAQDEEGWLEEVLAE